MQGKSEREINELKIKQTDETIKALKAQLISQKAIKEAQVEAATRNRDILSGILKFISAPITLLLSGIDLIGKQFGKNFNLVGTFDTLAEFVFDPKEVAKKGDDTIAETEKQLLDLQNQQAGFINSNRKIDEDAAKAKKDKRDKANAEEKAAAEKLAAEQLKIAQDKYKALSDCSIGW